MADSWFISIFNGPQTRTLLLFCILQIKEQDLSWWGCFCPLVHQIKNWSVWIVSFLLMNLDVCFNPFRTGKFPFTDFNLEVFRQDIRYKLVALNSIFTLSDLRFLQWTKNRSILKCNTICPKKVNWHFGGTYCLYLENWEVIQAVLAAWFMPVSCLAYSSTWWWLQHAPLKCQLAFTRLHSIMFQKKEFFPF